MKSATLAIEKISNGFVVTIDGKKIFCDVPEAVCGTLAEWALKTCENLTEMQIKEKDTAAELLKYLEQMKLIEAQKQAQIWAQPMGWSNQTVCASTIDTIK